jgi:hypothetical protein
VQKYQNLCESTDRVHLIQMSIKDQLLKKRGSSKLALQKFIYRIFTELSWYIFNIFKTIPKL